MKKETFGQYEKYSYSCLTSLYAKLLKAFKDLSNSKDYCYYLHVVYDYDENSRTNKLNTVEYNLQKILKEGLRLSNYSSLLRTSVEKKLADNESFIDDLLKHDYPYSPQDHKIVIIAFPKTIKVYGEDVNFSEKVFENSCGPIANPNYNQYSLPYDLVKSDYLPKEFILGVVDSYKPDNKNAENDSKSLQKYVKDGLDFFYIKNNKFYDYLSEEEKKNVIAPIKTQLIDVCGFKKEDTKEVMEDKIKNTMIIKDKESYDKGRYNSDFDWD